MAETRIRLINRDKRTALAILRAGAVAALLGAAAFAVAYVADSTAATYVALGVLALGALLVVIGTVGWGQARQADPDLAAFADATLLARWDYVVGELDAYADSLAKSYTFWAKIAALGVVAAGLMIAVAYAVGTRAAGTNRVLAGLAAFAIGVAAALVVYAIIRLCIALAVRPIRRASPAAAYVAADAAHFAGKHVRWTHRRGLLVFSLEEALVVDGQPAVLSLAVRTRVGSERTDAAARGVLKRLAGAATAAGHATHAPENGAPRVIRIPIPRGREPEARALARKLTRIARGQDDAE